MGGEGYGVCGVDPSPLEWSVTRATCGVLTEVEWEESPPILPRSLTRGIVILISILKFNFCRKVGFVKQSSSYQVSNVGSYN